MATQSGPRAIGRFSGTRSPSILPKVLVGLSVVLFALGVHLLIPASTPSSSAALLALVDQLAATIDRGSCGSPSTEQAESPSGGREPNTPATTATINPSNPAGSQTTLPTPGSLEPPSEEKSGFVSAPVPEQATTSTGAPTQSAPGAQPVAGASAQIYVDKVSICVLYGAKLPVDFDSFDAVDRTPIAIASDSTPGVELAAARLADDRVLLVGVEQAADSSTTGLAIVLLAAALAAGIAAFGMSGMRPKLLPSGSTAGQARTEMAGAGQPTRGASAALTRVTPNTPSPERTRPLLPIAIRSGTSGLTVDRGTNDTIDVYAATQAGPSHVIKGQTREDSYALGGIPGGGWTFAAVADGLSSARSSEIAAAVAVSRAVDDLSSEFRRIPPAQRDSPGWHQVATRIMGDVAGMLRSEFVDQRATESGYRPRNPVNTSKQDTEPSTTLTMAAIAALPGGLYTVHWAAVGDCEVVVFQPDGGVIWLTDNETKTGRVRSNAVDPLPAHPELVRTGVYLPPPGAVTVLASDGCADAIRRKPEQRQFAQHLLNMRQARPKEHAFGELVGFELDQLYDDRTLVAVWSNIAPIPEAGNRGPA